MNYSYSKELMGMVPGMCVCLRGYNHNQCCRIRIRSSKTGGFVSGPSPNRLYICLIDEESCMLISSLLVKHSPVWMGWGKRGCWGRARDWTALKNGHLIQSMGPERVEVRILALRAATLSNRVKFLSLQFFHHTCICCCCPCCKLPLSKYISPLCRLKINHVTEIQRRYRTCVYSWAL